MAAAGVIACAVPGVAAAQAPIVVNTTADHAPDGCETAPGDCTLREAIADRTAVEIEVPADDYVLSSLGQLEILRDVTIVSSGEGLATVRASAQIPSRVLLIGSDVTAHVSGLRIAEGDATGGFGGGILVESGAVLVLTDSEVAGNTAHSGGGIWADGTLEIQRSLIAFNSAQGDNDGGHGVGGGIGLSSDADPVALTNTTLSGNEVFGFGGGIATQRSMTLTNVSIVENEAEASEQQGPWGGGLYQDFPSGGGLRTTASNVLVVRNVGGGCRGTAGEFILDATNGMLEELDSVGGPTCNADPNTNFVVDDAMVAPLGDNAGLTQTHALQPGSPAIDAAGFPCPADDQRGFPRPADSTNCDIGAYEAVAEMGRIGGTPLAVWTDGLGRIQFRFDHEAAGVFYHPLDDAADAGLEIKHGDLYYRLGAGRTSLSPPVVDSAGNRHTMTSSYRVGPDLLVREAIEYTDGSREVDIDYEISSSSRQPFSFRAGHLADLFVAGNDEGTGIFTAGPPRFVAGRSGGVITGILERTPWDHFQEGFFGSVFGNFGDARLTDTVDSALVDNGVGVEWERTLNPEATETLSVTWRVGIPAPDPPADPPPSQSPPTGTVTQLPPVQLPPPEAGETVNVVPKQGTVRIRLRGTNKFVELEEGQQIPLGTEIDTRKGRVTLTAASNKSGGTATADFYDGLFRIGQTKGAKPTTTLKLTEKLTCPKAGTATTAAKKKKKRKLWGDGSGKFRTDGEFSSATVRGTRWLTQDTCKSTLTRVVKGRVAVRDRVKKKTVIVKAGKKYVARAKP